MRRASLVLFVFVIIGMAMPVTVMGRQDQAPLSYSAAVQPPQEVMVLEVPAIEPEMALAEDAYAKSAGPGPLRFALPFDVEVTPDTHGAWEAVPGGAIWRLRIAAPGSTDLNFGFGRFVLPKGATLHLASLTEAYFQGPYTAADNRDHGQLWTPVLPGSEAMIELFVPDYADFELKLVRVGRGYRDLFRRDLYTKQGSCNVDVICPLGDAWRNQIRSVAVYGTNGSTFCTGTLINNMRQDKRPFFITANHCTITSSNAASVVTYWNFQSATCGALNGGSLNQSTSGATFRAANYANDMTLIELSSQPSSAYNVYYSGWDARTTTTPQSSIGIHHPNTDEKAISFNDDPLTTTNSCIGTGGANTHWQVNNWEQGTTEPGSSGSGLFDPATKLLVGYLSGGSAACGNSLSDCYGKISVGWGYGLSTWLDPDGNGARYVAGMNPGSTGNLAPTARFTSSVSNLTATFTDSSTDSDGSVIAWSWTFGDGGTSTTRNPTRTYAAAGTYTVTLRVTDDKGATGTTSGQVTVSAAAGVVTLTNNTAVTGQSAAKGIWKHYRINVPAGSTNLVMQISGGSGDADLYTRFGSQPTSSSYDCRPYLGGNTESCTVAAPSSGYYYLGVYAYAAFSSVTVKASYTTGGGTGGTELVTNGGFESGASGWTFATYSSVTSGSAQAGTYKAQQGGRGVTTSTNFYQKIPGFNGATKTLKFYLKIASSEGTGTAYDYLRVRLKNTSGATVSTLATYSNKNKTTYANWKLVTLTVPSSALTNYRISFDVNEDSSVKSTFYVDSVSIK